VVVNAVHNGPALPAQPNQTVNELALLVVTNTALDTDLPALGLSYQLVSPPAGASIDANGVISWTPSQAQAPSTNVLTTVVTDNGVPPLSATNSFIVFVNAPQVVPPPVIQSIGLSNGIAAITWSTVSGQSYRLQYKDDLSVANWIDQPPDVPASGSTATATNALGSAQQRFYRVVVLPLGAP
jgi:hypothetical protein